MASTYKTNYDSDSQFSIVTDIEAKEYTTWKDRVVQRLLENVQVDGFRKGKAPINLAMAKIDQGRIQETTFNETVEKYGVDAIVEARKVLEADNRRILEYYLDVDPQTVGENDKGFTFKIIFSILPTVDLSCIDTLKLPKVDTQDLPKRLTVEEFLQNRRDYFVQTANTFHTEKNSEFKQYESFADLLDRDDEFKAAYPSESLFIEMFTRVYDDETKQIEGDVIKHKIILDMVANTPVFEMPQAKISSEIERIIKNIEEVSQGNNQTITEVVQGSGILQTEDRDKVFETVADAHPFVETYVRNEMRWTYIQRAMYEYRVEPKLTPEEVQDAGKVMSKNPAQYDVQGGLSQEQYESIAFDRMIRSKAANWLFETIQNSAKTTIITDLDSAPKTIKKKKTELTPTEEK